MKWNWRSRADLCGFYIYSVWLVIQRGVLKIESWGRRFGGGIREIIVKKYILNICFCFTANSSLPHDIFHAALNLLMLSFRCKNSNVPGLPFVYASNKRFIVKDRLVSVKLFIWILDDPLNSYVLFIWPNRSVISVAPFTVP